MASKRLAPKSVWADSRPSYLRVGSRRTSKRAKIPFAGGGKMVVCAIDFGDENPAYWIGKLCKHAGNPKLAEEPKFLSWAKLDPPEECKRTQETAFWISETVSKDPYFDAVTDFAIEQQLPMEVTTKPNGQKQSFVRNIAAYGLNNVVAGYMYAHAADREKKTKPLVPAFETYSPDHDDDLADEYEHQRKWDLRVCSVSPQQKFGTLGFECPKKKSERKEKIRKWTSEFLCQRERPLARWKKYFDEEAKQDDISDAFAMGYAYLLEAAKGVYFETEEDGEEKPQKPVPKTKKRKEPPKKALAAKKQKKDPPSSSSSENSSDDSSSDPSASSSSSSSSSSSDQNHPTIDLSNE